MCVHVSVLNVIVGITGVGHLLDSTQHFSLISYHYIVLQTNHQYNNYIHFHLIMVKKYVTYTWKHKIPGTQKQRPESLKDLAKCLDPS